MSTIHEHPAVVDARGDVVGRFGAAAVSVREDALPEAFDAITALIDTVERVTLASARAEAAIYLGLLIRFRSLEGSGNRKAMAELLTDIDAAIAAARKELG